MRIWVDVKNAAGTTLGEGPLYNVQSATVTRELDGAGEVSLELPAGDKRVQDLIENERRLAINIYHPDGTTRVPGIGIARDIKGSSTGLALAVSGPDQLDELKRFNTLLGRVYNGTSIVTILSSLIALASGWSATVGALPVNDAYMRFDGMSVLRALQEVCLRYGLHMRWESDHLLRIGALGDAAPLQVLQTGSHMMNDAYDNAEVAFIDQLTWRDTSEAIANWIAVQGGGQAKGSVSLAYSTRTQDRYTASESYEPGATATTYDPLQSSIGTYTKLAQSITLGDATWIGRVRLALAKLGSVTGTLTLRIETDSGGEPSGTLADARATTTFSESDLTSYSEGYQWEEFVFANAFYLYASTTYWLVLSTSRTTGAQEVWWYGSNSYTTDALKWHRVFLTWNAAIDKYYYLDGLIPSRIGAYLSQYDTSNFTGFHNLKSSAGTQKDLLAQSFSFTGDDERVNSVRFYMAKHGTPTGTLTVEIQADSSGSPSGTAITNGTSDGVSATTLQAGSPAWVEFDFSIPPEVSASTTYWVVLQTTDSVSATNFVQLGAELSPGTSLKYKNGATWYTGGISIHEVIVEGQVDPYEIQSTTGPDGNTLYYLADADSITAYGQIEKVFKANISPLEHTAEGLVNAANALYDAAANYLLRHKDKQTTYGLTLKKAYQNLKPGQKLPVRYDGVVIDLDGNEVGWRSVNAEFWITSVCERIGQDGSVSTSVDISDTDLPTPDIASSIMQTLEAAEMRDVIVAPTAATYTYVYQDLISADQNYTISAASGTAHTGKNAVFTIPISSTLMELIKVSVRIRTYPPRAFTLYDSGGKLWYVAEEGTHYPAGLSIYIDDTDRSSALGGPWLTGTGDDEPFDEEFDITDYLRSSGKPAFGDHVLSVQSAGRTISSAENVAVDGYAAQNVASTSPAPGIVECTVTIHCITQPIE